MKRLNCVVITALLAVTAGCSESDAQQHPDQIAARSSSEPAFGEVVFSGGLQTDPQDHGRPVVLIAKALSVTPEIFRDAFSGVTPARNGPPSPSHARANKQVLMDAIGKHGVTNDRLDEVSNYYRYRPQNDEIWTFVPARAKAVIEVGNVTGIEIIEPGSGYTTAPTVTIAGHEDIKITAELEFSTDLKRNGSVTNLAIVPAQ